MTLDACYRATCDAQPRCLASVMMPHGATADCRRQLAALGWRLIRWRRPKVVDRRDVGGSGRILYLCPEHRWWRPRYGIELPLPAIPRPT